jgi:class 3 adenylate cyclase
MNPAAAIVEACTGAVLFTDLVGFTEFTGAAGDVEALAVLEAQDRLVACTLRDRPEARVVKELGDGLMIWFPDARSGLEGAAQLMRAVERARAAREFPLAVRMGIHFGDALVRGDDLVGQNVNIAARVAELAGPGELLASDSLLEACDARALDLSLSPVGPVRAKGVARPIWLFRAQVDPL